MILQEVEQRKQLVIDINTHKDLFLIESSSFCIRNHRRVLMHIRRMMAWVRHEHIDVISISDVCPGSNYGQAKIRYTLLADRLAFLADCNTNLSENLLCKYQQIIIPKRCLDPFDEPRIDRLLSEIKTNEFILIGAFVEKDVMLTALGLLQRGKKVTVIMDAVGIYNKREAKLALLKLKEKGARLIETKQLAGTSHLKQIGACGCDSCKNLIATS